MSRLDVAKLVVSLEELAGREFQERVWVAGEGPDVSSFSEAVSQAFDDTGLSDVLDKDGLDLHVGADAVAALRELGTAISRVDQSLPPAALIDHPAMQRVRAAAQRALQLLKPGG